MKPMKQKLHIALALSAALLVSTVMPSFAQEIQEAELPALENAVTTNQDGSVELVNDELIDFIIPTSINGSDIHAIGDFAFYGCELFRTVTIPATITEIGANAFADCPYLESIILEGRVDTSDMILGENWSGDAEVLSEFVVVEEAETNEEASEEGQEETSEQPAENGSEQKPSEEENQDAATETEPGTEPGTDIGEQPSDEADDNTSEDVSSGSEDVESSENSEEQQDKSTSPSEPSDEAAQTEISDETSEEAVAATSEDASAEPVLEEDAG